MKTPILIALLSLAACGMDPEVAAVVEVDVVLPPPAEPPPPLPAAPETCPTLYCRADGSAFLWDACQPHPTGLACADCHRPRPSNSPPTCASVHVPTADCRACHAGFDGHDDHPLAAGMTCTSCHTDGRNAVACTTCHTK
jgi:hypothetical protein